MPSTILLSSCSLKWSRWKGFRRFAAFSTFFLGNVRPEHVFRKSGHWKELTGKWGTKAERENCTKFQCNVLRPNGFAVQLGPINHSPHQPLQVSSLCYHPPKIVCNTKTISCCISKRSSQFDNGMEMFFLQFNLYIGSIWNKSAKFFTVFLIFWIYPALALAVRRIEGIFISRKTHFHHTGIPRPLLLLLWR